MLKQDARGLRSRIRLAVLLFLSTQQFLQSQIIWDGDCDQFWDGGCTIDDVPKTNWDNDNYPGSGSEVLINLTGKPAVANVTVAGLAKIDVSSDFRILRDFSVTGNANLSNTKLEIDNSESLQVGGTLTTTGENLWNGGDVMAGGWENEGDLTIQGNAPWLVGTQLRNIGNITHDGARSLRNGASFYNEGLWHFTRNNADVTHDSSEGVQFTNASSGILRRSGEGVATMGVPFLNSGGALEVKSGE
ncbi:MAG: hypothetical protein KJT03_14305, partial [Verrucomicrobiae bacterium]|nr:hypothetical protein [Verrucomicrobiae bacterium]